MLFLRALLFLGTRYKCPCCGWRLRTFTRGGTSLKPRELGYCPRCNSKARHRSLWLFLGQKTNLFEAPLRLLHVSPKYALSRRLVRLTALDYLGTDLNERLNICCRSDVTAIPLFSDSVDAIICIHVLEEVRMDTTAMQELFRVLKPGGWAVISVPIRLDRETFEDPRFTTPLQRKRAFGEEAHLRIYGRDFADRLNDCGFVAKLSRASDQHESVHSRFGLRKDEHLFYCLKPLPRSPQPRQPDTNYSTSSRETLY